MTDETYSRTGRGRFTETRESAERYAEIHDLFLKGYTGIQIAAALGVSEATVSRAKTTMLEALRRPPTDELLTLEVGRLDDSLRNLDDLERIARDTLTRKHITVSNGRAVYDDTGEPVYDDEFALKALDRILKIETQRISVAARRARLLGLDQPVKTEVSGAVTYEIIGLDAGDAQ
jgi:hypothetical protein